MSLDELRKLTERLPKFPDEVSSTSEYTDYKMITKGLCRGWPLYVTDEVGVHRWYNTKDTEFPEHTHEETEWIIVFKGSIKLYVEGVEHKLEVGQSLKVMPDTKHSAILEEDCEYLTITIPPAREFPDGR